MNTGGQCTEKDFVGMKPWLFSPTNLSTSTVKASKHALVIIILRHYDCAWRYPYRVWNWRAPVHFTFWIYEQFTATSALESLPDQSATSATMSSRKCNYVCFHCINVWLNYVMRISKRLFVHDSTRTSIGHSFGTARFSLWFTLPKDQRPRIVLRILKTSEARMVFELGFSVIRTVTD